MFRKLCREILLDTGAEVSLIREDILPENYRCNGLMQIQKKTGNKPHTCKVALVDISLGRFNFIARCGIVNKDFIKIPSVILRHNLPGIYLEELLLQMRQRNWRKPRRRDTQENSSTQPTDETKPTHHHRWSRPHRKAPRRNRKML